MCFSKGFLAKVSFLTLALPVFASSAILTGLAVNRACESGNCNPSDLAANALTLGDSTTGTYDITITLPDSDTYNIKGSYANSFLKGTFLGFYPTVTYVGSSPSVASDTITLDMLQDFYSPGAANWDGAYNEKIPFNFPGRESGTGQVSYDGQSVGLLGPAGRGSTTFTQTTTLSGLTGPTLISDFMLNFTFDRLAVNGDFASSPTPEPAQTIPAALGLIGLFLFKARRSLFSRLGR